MTPRAASPEDRLDTYRHRRRFERTPEPEGGGSDERHPGGGRRFVVQRHRARRLHYDLRLEMGGVLASWAVPKGPTLDPGVRRLAVHVEDHPLEYADFEGVIPGGEYGGGDVVVWDRGTWDAPDDADPVEAVAHGELHFDLHGEKLAGRFVLVRTSPPVGARPADHEQWLLLHKHDEHAHPGWDAESDTRSVRSGRTNDEVAADPEALWHGDRPAAEAEERVGRVLDDELAELDRLGSEGDWEVDGTVVHLTNLDKVMFPASDASPVFTKRDVVRYYASMAATMLPYLTGRPVNLRRYPDGVEGSGFWQKELPAHAPEWITRWRNDEADPGETQVYAVVDRPATLVWLANSAALELHAWTSRAEAPHSPTWALIDLDPGTRTSHDDLLALARLHRTALEHLGVTARPKTSGRRGLQIWVPIRPGPSFEETRDWVETISRAVGDTVPDLVSWKWTKRDRKGRARLDYTQNAINKTLVAPYSLRAAAGAPVSVPLDWDELDDPELRSDRWHLDDVAQRLQERGDPFRSLLAVEQGLPELQR